MVFCTEPSAPYTRPTQQLSRPPPIQKLGAGNHILQLNIQCSWWWANVPETCRAKNTSIKLPRCIKLPFHFISWGRCAVKQHSRFYSVLKWTELTKHFVLKNGVCRLLCEICLTFPIPWESTTFEILLLKFYDTKYKVSLDAENTPCPVGPFKTWIFHRLVFLIFFEKYPQK